MNILEIGAGKVSIAESAMTDDFIVYVDRGYKIGSSIDEIEKYHKDHLACSRYFSNLDIFEFLDEYKYKFDKVIANRIFEHFEYCGGEIGRALEAINMITETNGTLEIIVPNSIKIARMVLDLENNIDIISHVDLLNRLLIINTENQNVKCDPHASTWTPEVAKIYIESEGTWKIKSIDDIGNYAGRDIYMKIVCSKT